MKSDANGVAFINKLKRDLLSVNCDPTGRSLSILGRALGLTEAKDDLGYGANYGSLNNGNSGKVLACGVVGLANRNNNYETRDISMAMTAARLAENNQNARRSTLEEGEQEEATTTASIAAVAAE